MITVTDAGKVAIAADAALNNLDDDVGDAAAEVLATASSEATRILMQEAVITNEDDANAAMRLAVHYKECYGAQELLDRGVAYLRPSMAKAAQ